jgi:hypothetical protein
MIEHPRVRDSYEFPTDLADDVAPGAFGWTVTVIACSAALLALNNAQAISGWAAGFEPGPVSNPIAQAADGWDEATASIGLGYGHARLHRIWKGMEQASWSGNGPVVEQAAK